MEQKTVDTKTLQQKPDFTKLGNDFINEYCRDFLPKPRNAYSFGCDKIWHDYVVPLQSQLAERDERIKELLESLRHLNEKTTEFYTRLNTVIHEDGLQELRSLMVLQLDAIRILRRLGL